MLEFQEDLYAILGLEEHASPEEIRKSYLRLAKKLHPDRFPNDPEQRAIAQADFSRVTRAHDILSDAKQRDEYNSLRTLAKHRSGGGHDSAGNDTQERAKSPTAERPGETGNSPSGAPASAGEAKTEQQGREVWAQKHFTRAQDLLRRQKFADAETAIKESLRLCPNNPDYHAKLAEIYIARNWPTYARSSIQAALKIDPKHVEAKQLDMKLSAKGAKEGNKPKAGFLDQLKGLLGNKKK